MSYVHPFSKRCDKSEIDLFSVPPTQQSLERGRWIDYAPLSSVENPDSAITYLIAGTDEYIDLSKTILTVRGEVTKGDGTTLSGGNQTSVAPVNNFLHSLFKQVDVYLNGKQVTPAIQSLQVDVGMFHPLVWDGAIKQGTYAYRAYIETLLNYDVSAKKSQFTSALYYKDTATQMDETGSGWDRQRQMLTVKKYVYLEQGIRVLRKGVRSFKMANSLFYRDLFLPTYS